MWMLKPILWPGAAGRLVKPEPGRIEQRSCWSRLDAGLRAGEAPPSCGYALEILTASKTSPPGLSENHGHAWIRLWQADGHYVSVGFYPDESTGIDPETVPGLRYPGMLLSPDKYDRVGWPQISTLIPLSPDQHAELVAWIEDLQSCRNTGALMFDMVDRNCAGFVAAVAARAGVAVDADQPVLAFLPSALHLPAVVSRWIRPLRRLIYRMGLALFGGFSTLDWYWIREETGVKRQSVCGQTPLFGSVWDVLRSNVPFNHVRAIQAWQRAHAGAAEKVIVVPEVVPSPLGSSGISAKGNG